MCGHKQPRKLSERTLTCDCGNQLNRDLNSAINIMARFLLLKSEFDFLLHQPSVNEESFLSNWQGFLRHTVNGKTKVSYSSSSNPEVIVGSADSQETPCESWG
ncbi:MAG: zinc ribbon domain-containing protein [Candidatus Hodarchaeota archaeon]